MGRTRRADAERETTGRGPADGVHEFGRRCGLEHEAGRAEPERRVGVLRVVVGGHHDDRGSRGGGAAARAVEKGQAAGRPEPDVEQDDVGHRRGRGAGGLPRSSRRGRPRRCPLPAPGAPPSRREAPGDRRRWRPGSVPDHRPWPRTDRSTRPPLERDVGPAGRPASDVEDRADLLGPLAHAEDPEMTGRRRVLGRAGLDARPGVVDRQATRRYPSPDSGRRSAAARA